MHIRARGWSLAFTVSQVIGVVLICAFVSSCWSALMHNFGRLGIQLNFGFMHIESGFQVTQSWLLHHRHDSNLHVLLIGLLNTLVVSAVAMFLAMCVAVIVVFFRQSRVSLLRYIAQVYVSIFRHVPLLVQILFWYNLWVLKCPDVQNTIDFFGVMLNNRGFFLPVVTLGVWYWWIMGVIFFTMVLVLRLGQWRMVCGQKVRCFSLWPRLVVWFVISYFVLLLFAIHQGAVAWPTMGRFNIQGWQINPEFIALCLGLALYTAAYQAETIRGAMMSVGTGQVEAGYVLGLSRWQIFQTVVFPQSLPAMLPPTANHLMNLTKNSSLGVAVGYPEMFAVFAGTVLNQTGRAVEIMGIVMLIYLLLSMMILAVINVINQRQSRWKGGCQR